MCEGADLGGDCGGCDCGGCDCGCCDCGGCDCVSCDCGCGGMNGGCGGMYVGPLCEPSERGRRNCLFASLGISFAGIVVLSVFVSQADHSVRTPAVCNDRLNNDGTVMVTLTTGCKESPALASTCTFNVEAVSSFNRYPNLFRSVCKNYNPQAQQSNFSNDNKSICNEYFRNHSFSCYVIDGKDMQENTTLLFQW